MNDDHQDFEHFDELTNLLRKVSGIHLIRSSKNSSLLAARLGRVMERRGIRTYAEYLKLLKSGRTEDINEFISAMTTNTTEFFRESRHFDLLKKSLPDLLRSRAVEGHFDLRIWCAASSSGQEVYSLLMTLLEADPRLVNADMKMLATDIDLTILERASKGYYTDSEIASVPPVYRLKYFTAQKGKGHVVNSSLRKFVTFAPFNLMNEVYPFHQGFDIVFCRNVLIYFDRETAVRVTENIGRSMRSSGFLFLGHSEAGLVKSTSFAPESSAFYRKNRA